MLRSLPMRRFYTTFEAAHVLGVSLPTVVNWIKARRLKAHRTPGGHRRIAREELAAFMLRHGMPMPEELADAVESGRRVLVVGEPGPVLDQVIRQLEAASLVALPSRPGFCAGAGAARHHPDLVVLVDPPADGGDTLAGLRGDAALSAVPVVAAARAENVQRLRASGCALVLASPIPDGALAEAASLALAGATVAARRRP
ncbi:MAG TPA: helix-turn-helix domain-containing protein [Anaeromyxobacteraceae bacterium]|nr:helix-turn-helix domain-containing protein [Anaeromyxobacteraceae bacterium]